MILEEKKNIYQKLQKCRVEVQDAGVKKTGKNKFSGYDYFELSDFLPEINKSMDKNQLTSVFLFTKEKATLTIIDSEEPEKKIEFTTPVAVTPLKGCNEMQNIGAAQSYARRYLYFMAFEIAESDVLDSNNTEPDEEEEYQRKKIDFTKVSTIREMLKKTNSSEKTIFKFFKVNRLEDITNGQFRKVMDSLEKKEKELEENHEKLEKIKQQKQQEKIPDLGI